MSSVRIGVDVGGTFTDLVLADGRRDQLFTGKLLTTPDDPSRAIMEGVERILREADVDPADVSGLVHGTTLVTNTVIEQTGARVGLITTAGFRDAIEMGREIRYDLYDLFLEPSPTLVPRARRIGVRGRIDTNGNELQALDEDEVRAAAIALREEHRVEAIAICFMHAYRNPEHEQRAQAIVLEQCPDLPVTMSSAVAPEIREFERASTAVANAYVLPLMRGYLRSLAAQLEARGISAPLHIMLSGGGIATVAQASEFPIRLIESGPAAGAMAASYFSGLIDEPDLISFDMGGTTAKICLIEGGAPRRAHEFEAGRVRRFRKGSGIPLKITVVDMIEIGAGGGSLASVDTMGLLKVGPRSAGSVPGPICYGRGGESPAVTDADLKLGLLNPQYFLGGEMALAADTLDAAIDASLAQALGMDVQAVASGIHDVVNENMAAATRRYLAEKGRDPRRYSMVAFGGAGPLHAYGLAQKLKLKRIVVPLGAGVTSALGFLVAPPAVDDVRSYVSRLGSVDLDHVNALYADMEARAIEDLRAAGANPSAVKFTRTADMRHVGQGFEIAVPVPGGLLVAADEQTLRAAFFDAYATLFERRVEDVPVETMSWRLQAEAPAPDLMITSQHDADVVPRPRAQRPLTLPGLGTMMADVYDRYALTPGTSFDGPAIVEERESTAVAGPDCKLSVDAHLNLIIDIEY
jgi:N-methylhydantoinase A